MNPDLMSNCDIYEENLECFVLEVSEQAAYFLILTVQRFLGLNNRSIDVDYHLKSFTKSS
uniref:Uncharacterized protein n=1 Tax=Schistosoma haematobium TaxID=6185 RepID=A0A094ZSL2_SCHHA